MWMKSLGRTEPGILMARRTTSGPRRQYQLVHNFAEQLRTLAPDSGAYFVREVCSLWLMYVTDKVC